MNKEINDEIFEKEKSYYLSKIEELNQTYNLKQNTSNDTTNYNYNEIEELFRKYESLLQELNSNEKLFDMIFDSYLLLLKTYQNSCLENSKTSKNNESITIISNTIVETINMLKFTCKLNNNKLNHLNNILGQVLYYFSHLCPVNIENRSLNDIIDKYYLIFEKICDGYFLSEQSNFEGNKNTSDMEYVKFKNNSSYLLLEMIKKLNSKFETKEYFICDSLKKNILLYEKMFNIPFEYTDLTEKKFNKILLNSLVLEY